MTQLPKRQRKRKKAKASKPAPVFTHLIRRVVITEDTDLQTLMTERSWVISWYEKPYLGKNTPQNSGDTKNEDEPTI